MSNNEEERAVYDMRAKILKDKASALNSAKKEGIQEGIQKGIKEGRKEEKLNIARNLLDILDNETIALKTGLEIDEIQELR